MDKEQLIPHLEWEYSNFPITISQLKFEKTNWGFDDSAIITVWRDKSLSLCGKISGNNIHPQSVNEVHYIGKGNIIEGQTITGKDDLGNTIEIKGCCLYNYQFNSWERSAEGWYASGQLIMDSIFIKFSSSDKEQNKLIRYDWFICNKTDVHFAGTTFRKNLQMKVRVGIDKHDDSIENYLGSSSSGDYALITLPDIEFIVAKVPDVFVPEQLNGLCLEFRYDWKQLNNDLLDGTESFLSFLLGNKLFYLGYSLANGEHLTEAFLISNNEVKITSVMPPIRFNRKYQWGDISWLLNQFLPEYLKLRKALPLDEAISRYWIAKNTPVGSNLPVLASALEIIASAYLKSIDDKNINEYLPEQKYLTLIEKEKNKLADKLSSIKDGDKIMNKILGAFRKVPSEKMNYFYSSIGLSISKNEQKAIALRNKMAHSYRDYSDEETAHQDIVYTRIYEMLFNRTILKLLGYEHFYIDYSMQGGLLKQIKVPAGEKS